MTHNIVIGFSKSKLPFPIIGWLIQWAQLGRYSHCYLKVWNHYREKWVVIDATGHGVRVGSEEEWLKSNRPVKEYKLQGTPDQAANLLWWGIDRGRQEYPKKEVLGNLFQIIFRLKKNPFRQGSNVPKCNELCALAIEEVLGIEIEQNLDDIDLIWLDNFLQEHFS